MNDLPVRGMLHLLLGGKVSETIVIKQEVTVLGREGADVVLATLVLDAPMLDAAPRGGAGGRERAHRRHGRPERPPRG